MADHIAAILALLTGAGMTVYDTIVPAKPSFPYVLIEAPLLSEETQTLGRPARADVKDYVRCTATDLGIEGARETQRRAYVALHQAQPVVDGYRAWMHRFAAGAFAPDRDVTLPDGGNPVFSTDQYRYRATPI